MSKQADQYLTDRNTSALWWKKLFMPNSLYGRLSILIISTAIILFVFLAWIIFSLSNNYLENVTTRCGKRVASLINQTIQGSMVSGNHQELLDTINKVHEIPGVKAIRIYDSEGQIKFYTPGSVSKTSILPYSHFQSSKDIAKTEIQSVCVHDIEQNNDRNMIIHAPIMAQPTCHTANCHQNNPHSDILGYTEIELPLGELDSALDRILYDYFSIVIIFLALLIASLLYFIQHRINIPLKRIVIASQAVTAGNMSVRVDVEPDDFYDIHQVGLALNTMLDSIKKSNRELQQWSNRLETKVRIKSEDIAKSQNEFYQIERMASLGRLSSSVAHEINNPLAGILTYAKLVSRILQGPSLPEDKKVAILKHLDMIQSETTRCGNIVKGLLNFSRDRSTKFDALHLNIVLRESVQLIQHSFHIANVRLETDFSAANDQIEANGNQVIQACLAVLTNALEAVHNDGNSQVSYRSFNPDTDHIAVEIKDNGIGISPEDQKHIFEPFFSSKKEMSGIGLGLAVTYGILEQHKAKASVTSSPGMGTTMTFVFELVDKGQEDGKQSIHIDR